MGDFNAKIGSDNTSYKKIMGKHGLGDINENGELFANLCAMNQLVMWGSIFPHKKTHKARWVLADQRTENQIDHICISKSFRRTLKDVRVKRGADVALGHHSLVATLTLRLKRHCHPAGSRTQYYVDLFRAQRMRDRYQVLQDLYDAEGVTDIETEWRRVKKVWTEACKETGSIRRGSQGSTEKCSEGQKSLHRQFGKGSRGSSREKEYERSI